MADSRGDLRRLTSRHLLRLLETRLGYGPKTLARVFRLRRTLSIADQPH